MSSLWLNGNTIQALEIVEPNEDSDVYFIKVQIGRMGSSFKLQQFPAKDSIEADERSHEIMKGLRDKGFHFLGQGYIDKKKKTYILETDAADMEDPLKPSTFVALSKIKGAFARQRGR